MPPPFEAPPVRRSWPRRMLNRMEVDRAVFYALAARVWQFAAGPVTLALIAMFFSAEVQGYFYTFGSLLALQTFVELGLQFVISVTASHEWAHLRLDERGRVVGEAEPLSRLASLTRAGLKWYGAAAAVFVAGVGVAGAAFLMQSPTRTVDWPAPWLCLVVLTGLSLCTAPLVAILEGCGQIAVVNRFRFVQAVMGNAAVWILIPLGAELWTAVAVAGVKACWDVWLVLGRYATFFGSLRQAGPGARVDWSSEIWPMQWRLGIQVVFNYFGHSLVTLVMFHYHGPAVAGRMGMTWNILTTLQGAALAWIQTRLPLFGMLIRQREYGELDRVFFRLTAISLGVLTAGGGAFCAAVIGVGWLGSGAVNGRVPEVVRLISAQIAERILPPLPTALFTLAIVLLYVPQCLGLYLRAHKRDPLLLLTIAGNAAIGLLVWQWGMRYGPLGSSVGYLAVVGLCTLPGHVAIWWRCRREWH